jgi:ParB family chromosome partitioning protein
MGKLKAPPTAGFNAGKNYYAKMADVNEIMIDPVISQVFIYKQQMAQEISESIKADGYDKSQPLTLWKGKNVLLDGHTRLAAAKMAGLTEVPVVEMAFEEKEDAIFYTFQRQAMRRNLTPAEIFAALKLLPARKEKDGTGRAAERLAEQLGVSAAHIYHAKRVAKDAPEEDIEAVKEGKMSMKEAYMKITQPPSYKNRKIKVAANELPAAKEDIKTALDNLNSGMGFVKNGDAEKAFAFFEKARGQLEGLLCRYSI